MTRKFIALHDRDLLFFNRKKQLGFLYGTFVYVSGYKGFFGILDRENGIIYYFEIEPLE